MRCALTGSVYCLPLLRPVKFNTMIRRRTPPPSGVRSINRSSGLTARRRPSGGWELVIAGDRSMPVP